MSLSTLAVAVLSLTTPNACLDARSLAEDIARAEMPERRSPMYRAVSCGPI